MTHPNNVLPSWHALILERNLLQGIERLVKTLLNEAVDRPLVGDHRRQMIEGVKQVLLVSGGALHQLQRFVADHHHLCRGVQQRRLCGQILADRIADEREILKARIQQIEHEDSHRRLSIGIIVTGKRIDRVRLGRFKGKDRLRSLVFGDREVVFGESIDYRAAFFVQHRHIQKDQARRYLNRRRIGRSL